MDFAQAQGPSSRKTTGLALVVALHVLVGWGLANGLATKVVEVVKAPIETVLVEEIKPPPPPPPPENLPPPPPRALPPPPAYVPPPEVQVTAPPAPTITTTTVAPPPTEVHISPAPPVVTAPPAPPAVAARPAIGNVNACKPQYTAAAARAEATGVTKVRFTVDANGRMTNAEIVRKSGSSREHRELDRAAVEALSRCQFQAGRDVNGSPVGGTFDVEYVWNLE